MPLLFYLPLIIWRGLFKVAQDDSLCLWASPCSLIGTRWLRWLRMLSRSWADYLEKSLARNTTGRSAWAFSSRNLRDARSSITSRSRMN